MRISCDSDDPGYQTWYARRHGGWVVTLDGVVQRYAITADDVKGYVVRIRRTPDNRPVLDEVKKTIARERIDGKVEIIVPPERPA